MDYPYLYEMHIHTSACSACALSPMRDMVDAAKAHGYAGFVITNHFYRGNTAIDRQLPWRDFAGAYVRDWEEGYAYGKEQGIDVLFGLEEGIGGGKEVLLYGLTPDAVLGEPDMPKMPLAELSAFTHENGGVIYQAHPFRARGYIIDPDAEPEYEYLDGIEVFNAGDGRDRDVMALEFANRHAIRCIGGGDTHEARNVGHTGLAFPARLPDNAALLAALRSEDYRFIIRDRQYTRAELDTALVY